MEQTSPLVISISRQRGCGGAYLGQKLAKSLEMAYLDRELVTEIADKLEIPVEAVEAHDERITSLWESIIESLGISNPWLYNPPPINAPANQVRQLESESILKIAAEQSVVIVGRGASYLLRKHPKHVSIFLYACRKFRLQRIEEIYKVPHQEAVKIIEKADNDRAVYNKALSGTDMNDATQYHLALDTGVFGLDNAETLILQYVRDRFGDLK
jgi:cytidylate kinase